MTKDLGNIMLLTYGINDMHQTGSGVCRASLRTNGPRRDSLIIATSSLGIRISQAGTSAGLAGDSRR